MVESVYMCGRCGICRTASEYYIMCEPGGETRYQLRKMWPRRFLAILFIWLCDFLSFATTGLLQCVTASNSAVNVAMDGSAPPGVVWVVQMSDVHLSKWTPSRGRALRKALGHSLKHIHPAIVLVTGDLTDAKSKDMKTTQQEEVEWIEYRQSFLSIAEESGIPLHHFFDLRGNHDKYGVPGLHSPLDYHSKYSISAALNRTALVQSVTVQGGDGGKHLFVGFDDSMEVGLRGPSNLFGHPTDVVLAQLDEELKSRAPVAKIVYGHFPMSFTTSSETGKRVEDVMASNNVTAYVCGHLHTTFGRQLYKHHKEHTGEFWEWEMGDWRISRMMRVMAIDQGHTSFVDVELIPPKDAAEGEFTMPTIILQTYPLDSRFMLSKGYKAQELNSIRALVFSESTPAGVNATIYDITSHSPKMVNSFLMKETDQGSRYYTADWDRERYSGLHYAIQIVVETRNGTLLKSEMRFVGEPKTFHLTFLAFLILGIKWERVFPVALWGPMSLLVLFLVASGVFLWWLRKHGKYEEWMTSVFRPPWTLVKVFRWPFGGLVELCSRDFLVWVLVVFYVFYLSFFPWFWGRILADDYPTGSMSLRGWTVKPSKVDTVKEMSGLGVPDVVVIVMTYLYLVLIPLLLVISILSAERAAFEFHWQTLGKCLKKNKRNGDDIESTQIDEESDSLINSKTSSDLHRHLFSGKKRKGLFVGCLAIGFILWQLCLMIGRAYGFSALATAPVYAWSVPGLLVFSFYQTLRTSCRCTGCLKP